MRSLILVTLFSFSSLSFAASTAHCTKSEADYRPGSQQEFAFTCYKRITDSAYRWSRDFIGIDRYEQYKYSKSNQCDANAQVLQAPYDFARKKRRSLREDCDFNLGGDAYIKYDPMTNNYN